MDSLGLRLIRSYIEEKDPTVLADHHLTRDDLFEEAGKAFEWIQNYIRTHGDWPSAKVVEENCGISLEENADNLKYICDAVRKRTLGVAHGGNSQPPVEL